MLHSFVHSFRVCFKKSINYYIKTWNWKDVNIPCIPVTFEFKGFSSLVSRFWTLLLLWLGFFFFFEIGIQTGIGIGQQIVVFIAALLTLIGWAILYEYKKKKRLNREREKKKKLKIKTGNSITLKFTELEKPYWT